MSRFGYKHPYQMKEWYRRTEIPITNKDLGKPGGSGKNRKLKKAEIAQIYGQMTQKQYFELYGDPDDDRRMPKFVPLDE